VSYTYRHIRRNQQPKGVQKKNVVHEILLFEGLAGPLPLKIEIKLDAKKRNK